MGVHNAAEGIFDIALRHGIDTRDFSLVVYGAAGPMLLPGILDVTPLRRVIVPPNPGLFSALGLLSSDLVFTDQRSSYEMLSDDRAATIDSIYASMEQTLLDRLQLTRADVRMERSFDGRLAGQLQNTPFVPVPDGHIDGSVLAQMIESFHDVYEQRTGNRVSMLPVQAVTYRVQAIVAADKVQYPPIERRPAGTGPNLKPKTFHHLADGPVEGVEARREELLAGDVIDGPAVVREDLSTTFVPIGRRLVVGDHGEFYIS